LKKSELPVVFIAKLKIGLAGIIFASVLVAARTPPTNLKNIKPLPDTAGVRHLHDTLISQAPDTLLKWAPSGSSGGFRSATDMRIQAGDTLTAGLLAMRTVAHDPEQASWGQYRLESLLRGPVEEDAPPKNKPPSAWIKAWLAPQPWENEVSLHALENALWNASPPEWAYQVATRRLAFLKSGEDLALWFHVGQQLLSKGKPILAAQALSRIQWDSANQVKSLNSLLAPAYRISLLTYLANKQWVKAADLADKTMDLPVGNEADTRLFRIEACLREGRFTVAQKLLTELTHPAYLEVKQLMGIRLAIGQGKYDGALRELQILKDKEPRQTSSGTILHWQGVTYALRGELARAESLWIASSGYTQSPEIGRTLEYRLALLSDSNAISPFLSGQPEMANSVQTKLTKLKGVPPRSPLWISSQKLVFEYQKGLGDTLSAQKTLLNLSSLSPMGAGGPLIDEAKALIGYMQESNNPQAAIAAYESLLVQSQQGIPSEFARQRLPRLSED